MITIHKCTNIPVPNKEGIKLISFITIIILEIINIIFLELEILNRTVRVCIFDGVSVSTFIYSGFL